MLPKVLTVVLQIQGMANRVEVLQNGFCHSSPRDEVGSGETFPKADDLPFVRANCSCVLITGSVNVIVDTMTPWDSDFILKSLNSRGLKPDDIDYVVSTHGHSDHIGNNNLFLKAKHIVGYCVSFQDKYFLHPFDKGKSYYQLKLSEILHFFHSIFIF